LEVNIQEILENDIRNIQRLNEHRRMQQSLDTVIQVNESHHPLSVTRNFSMSPVHDRANNLHLPVSDEETNYFNNKRKKFKSLPNLSASSENLIHVPVY
jgi:ABC-type branched-subunit amino acid transport system ATPase component